MSAVQVWGSVNNVGGNAVPGKAVKEGLVACRRRQGCPPVASSRQWHQRGRGGPVVCCPRTYEPSLRRKCAWETWESQRSQAEETCTNVSAIRWLPAWQGRPYDRQGTSRGGQGPLLSAHARANTVWWSEVTLGETAHRGRGNVNERYWYQMVPAGVVPTTDRGTAEEDSAAGGAPPPPPPPPPTIYPCTCESAVHAHVCEQTLVKRSNVGCNGAAVRPRDPCEGALVCWRRHRQVSRPPGV